MAVVSTGGIRASSVAAKQIGPAVRYAHSRLGQSTEELMVEAYGLSGGFVSGGLVSAGLPSLSRLLSVGLSFG